MVTKNRGPAGRDRGATEERLLAATGRVLARDGFRGLGVNAVAREAGTDKVLVYRYFGGLPGLLEAYARSADFWPGEEELLPGGPKLDGDPAAAAAALLARLARGLRKRPATLDVLAWELVEPNPLAERTAEARERSGMALLGRLGPELSPGVDLPAVAAVLSAGLTYLALRSRTAPAWLGVPLQDEAGWRRLERAVEALVRALLPAGNEIRTQASRRTPRRRKS
jgi:AcrR family transcriptional regulator